MNTEEILVLENNFDLYVHLKSNVKCNIGSCEIHDSLFNYYCFQCKRSICEVCKFSFHPEHSVIYKPLITMNDSMIATIFSNLDKLINETESFSKPSKLIKEAKDKIDAEFSLLESKLNELKQLRLQQVDTTFSTDADAKILIKNIKESKSILKEFYDKNKDFLKGDGVSDDDSFIFLQLYDICNTGKLSSECYSEIIKQLNDFYNDNDLNLDMKYQNILSEINESIKKQRNQNNAQGNKSSLISEKALPVLDSKSKTSLRKISSNALANSNNKERNSGESKLTSKKEIGKFKIFIDKEKLTDNLYKDLNLKVKYLQDNIEDFKDNVFNSFKKENSLSEIEKIVKMFEEKTSKRINFTNKSGIKFSGSNVKSGMLNRSKASLQSIRKDKEKEDDKKKEEVERRKSIGKVLLGEKLEDISKDVKNSKVKPQTTKNQKKNLFSLEEKEDEDNENLDLYNSNFHSKEHSDDEVEVNISKNIKQSDKIMTKLNNMFRPKPKVINEKKKQIQLKKTQTNSEEEKFKLNKKLVDLIQENKNLINMIKTRNNISLVINTIRRYFSFMTLEYSRKSNPILSRGLSTHFLELAAEHEKKAEENSIKIIEGTNEIHVYRRKERKIEKIKVVFDQKKHTSTYFHVGCRYIFSQNKVYITGGKDSLGEKKVFLCYDFKNEKLLRLPDMTCSHSYHAMQYHDSLKSVFVIGGENNLNCEMYDFYLNMWNVIPNLNVPRANSSLYIDQVGTFTYALCGQTGLASTQSYTDCIEYLDLVDMNQGWAKIELRNRDNIDLKSNEIKIFTLLEDRLLIYGGKESRSQKTCFALFNIKTFELTKVDDDILEKMKKVNFITSVTGNK